MGVPLGNWRLYPDMLAAGKGQPARRRLRQERRRDNLLTLYHLGQGHGGASFWNLSHTRSNLNSSVPALSPWNTSVGGSRPRSETVEGDVTRLTRWVKLVREVAEDVWS